MGRRLSFVLFLMVSIMIVAAGCAPAAPPAAETGPAEAAPAPADEASTEPKHGGILTYGLVGDPPSLDPHVQKGAADATVKNMVYSRLITWDRDMKLAPELAESWEVVDDTTIKFNLRHGVKFHNGAELTADDVVFSFERILNPDIGRQRRRCFCRDDL